VTTPSSSLIASASIWLWATTRSIDQPRAEAGIDSSAAAAVADINSEAPQDWVDRYLAVLGVDE
jgi:hypothetical protein